MANTIVRVVTFSALVACVFKNVAECPGVV